MKDIKQEKIEDAPFDATKIDRIADYMKELAELDQILVTKGQFIDLLDTLAVPRLAKEDITVSDQEILAVLKELRDGIVGLRPYPKKGKKTK